MLLLQKRCYEKKVDTFFFTARASSYVLCSQKKKLIVSFFFIFSKGELTIDEEEFFPSLSLLVSHYERDADGLCTQLTLPLLQQPGDRAEKAFKDAGWVIDRTELTIGAVVSCKKHCLEIYLKLDKKK